MEITNISKAKNSNKPKQYKHSVISKYQRYDANDKYN